MYLTGEFKVEKYNRSPQLRLGLNDDIAIDNFSGGRGASTGIEQRFTIHYLTTGDRNPLKLTANERRYLITEPQIGRAV